MRPIQKYAVGSQILAEDNSLTISEDYVPYSDAKIPLIANLGEYCSYCEVHNPNQRDLQVEHVQPKGLKQYAGLTTKWNNFLLACSTCNGKDNKGSKDVVLSEIHLPHLNNTFLSLQYLQGGVIRVNPELKGKSRLHAEALYKLVGFNKKPSEHAPTDNRWRKRCDVWNTAQRYLDKYNEGKADIETIIDLAKAEGHWSIWFTAFLNHDEVRRRLIESFPGTSRNCFDPDNHYEPVNRNPDNDEDPV